MNKKVTIFLILSFIISKSFSQNFEWVKYGAGTSAVFTAGSSMAIDSLRNVYVLGSFNFGPLIFEMDTLLPKGFGDIYLVKYDSTGAYQWVKMIAGKFQDNLSVGNNQISIDNNSDVYVTGQ